MRAIRHEAALDRPAAGGGGTVRDHWLKAAKSRAAATRTKARHALDGPPYPAELAYLDAWSLELVGRSGAGASGPAPLTYESIAAWADMTERRPAPHEVRALMLLDAARLAALQPDPSARDGKHA